MRLFKAEKSPCKQSSIKNSGYTQNSVKYLLFSQIFKIFGYKYIFDHSVKQITHRNRICSIHWNWLFSFNFHIWIRFFQKATSEIVNMCCITCQTPSSLRHPLKNELMIWTTYFNYSFQIVNEVDVLIIHGRSPERLKNCESEIKKVTTCDTKVHSVIGDLSNIDDVKDIAR